MIRYAYQPSSEIVRVSENMVNKGFHCLCIRFENIINFLNVNIETPLQIFLFDSSDVSHHSSIRIYFTNFSELSDEIIEWLKLTCLFGKTQCYLHFCAAGQTQWVKSPWNKTTVPLNGLGEAIKSFDKVS